MTKITSEIAARFAHVASDHIQREYPNKLEHVLCGPEDALGPKELHPIFYGSFDWHSCVHGYWLLLTLRRLYPDAAFAADITALANEMLVPEKVAGELDYLDRAYTGAFERPYGWAWMLALHGETVRHGDAEWGAALEPLARAFAKRFHDFLPKQTYPIRTGTHYNTAFAMVLALQWAEQYDAALVDLIHVRARDYFIADKDCPAWEPGGDEFLSSAMCEALCMKRVLPDQEFRKWFADFLPNIAEHQPATLFTPAFVSDRSDGKIAHLDGLNLSRAWCWRSIADALDGSVRELALHNANLHIEASLQHIAGDYAGEHWLATFALLALLADE